MGEIKQTNFRINNETADQFRAFCEENGMNQAQGFDHLMQVLELSQAKEYIPERRVEIEEFERNIKAVMSGYINSVEIAKNTEIRVREEFNTALVRKDEVIDTLHKKVEEYKEVVDQAIKRAEDAEEKQKKAEDTANQAQKMQESAEKTASDKAEMYEMSQSQLKEALKKLEEYPELKKKTVLLEEKLATAEQTIVSNQKDAEMSKERALMDAQKKFDDKLSDMEKQLDKALNEANNDKIKALLDLEHTKDKQIAELEIALSKAETSAEEKDKQLQKQEEKVDKLQLKLDDLTAKIAELKIQNALLVQNDTNEE